MNDETIRLIQEDLDGVLQTEDRHRLEAVLSTNPEASALHADLARISNAIASMPAESAPLGFTRKVMDRLPAAPARSLATDRTAMSPARRFMNRLVAPANRRMAFAFALGVFMTVAVVGTLSGPDMIDPGAAAGTMTGIVPTTEVFPIADPAGTLTVERTTSGTNVTLSVSDASSALELRIAGTESILERILLAATGNASITRTADGLSILSQEPIRIVVAPGDASGLDLLLLVNGTERFRESVSVGSSN